MKPEPIIAPYVKPGMTVLEPGPGMGLFTLPLAGMVGDGGRVVAVDLQPQMVERLKRRAERARVASRVEARVSSADSLGVHDLPGRVDFTLAFAMVHELPEKHPFFAEVASASKHGALLLLAEPAGHVKAEEFETEINRAREAGFEVVERPTIKRSQAVLLRRRG